MIQPELEQAKNRATKTYNAAADHYDDAANSFWERFGSRTVQRLGLADGSTVLDVCCGAGASALPAASIVSPRGRVLGIDLAERLLENARRKALARGLDNAVFRCGDMLDLRLEEQFDAVVCVFGIFFVPDMQAALRSLHGRVKPGGRLAVTTWGPRFFEPATGEFWESVRAERPDLYRGFNPWDRICDPPSLRKLFEDSGIANVEIIAESGRHPIPSPEAWWSAVLGSGYRGTLDQLSPEAAARVRQRNENYIRASGTVQVEANVVYAIAQC
jgi:ubiquinone/menaquinone biosynthesis C-methylase UbiE